MLFDHQHTGTLGEQIAASGESAVGTRTVARNCRGDIGCSLILRDIAWVQPCDRNFLHARRLEGGNFRGSDLSALLEHQIALPDRMHRGSAERISYRYCTELHAASAF